MSDEQQRPVSEIRLVAEGGLAEVALAFAVVVPWLVGVVTLVRWVL